MKLASIVFLAATLAVSLRAARAIGIFCQHQHIPQPPVTTLITTFTLVPYTRTCIPRDYLANPDDEGCPSLKTEDVDTLLERGVPHVSSSLMDDETLTEKSRRVERIAPFYKWFSASPYFEWYCVQFTTTTFTSAVITKTFDVLIPDIYSVFKCLPSDMVVC